MSACLRRFPIPLVLGGAILVWSVGSLVVGQPKATPDKDLALGTWILDVEKSIYRPGPAPRSQTRTYEAHPDGVLAKITTVDADGNSLSAEYVADYDSLEYPITGSMTVDALSLKRVNAYTAEATLMHASKVIGRARRVISEDGKTMTITYKGTGQRGQEVDITAVYDKKEST